MPAPSEFLLCLFLKPNRQTKQPTSRSAASATTPAAIPAINPTFELDLELVFTGIGSCFGAVTGLEAIAANKKTKTTVRFDKDHHYKCRGKSALKRSSRVNNIQETVT